MSDTLRPRFGRYGPTGTGSNCCGINARGKTAWETGQILGISERNVRWHIEEAQRKLMTNNKTATVATAIVNREILI